MENQMKDLKPHEWNKANNLFKKISVRAIVVRSLFMDFINTTTLLQSMNEKQRKCFSLLINKWKQKIDDNSVNDYLETKTLHAMLNSKFIEDDAWKKYIVEHTKMRIELIEFNYVCKGLDIHPI